MWDTFQVTENILVGLRENMENITQYPTENSKYQQNTDGIWALSFWMILGQINFTEHRPWALKVLQPVKTFPNFYRMQWFISTVFTPAHNQILFWSSCISILSSQLSLSVQNVPAIVLYIFNIFPMHITCSTHWFDEPKIMWWKVQIMELSISSEADLTLHSYGMSV
jgi:hypothetical protein